MSEMKPCPFCGAPAMLRKHEERIKPFFVRCGNLDCRLIVATDYFATKDEAIEAWNRRANDNK